MEKNVGNQFLAQQRKRPYLTMKLLIRQFLMSFADELLTTLGHAFPKNK